MHELSIATSIIKSAEVELIENKAESIKEIFLEIGKLSGVEIASLTFVWELAAKGTALENSKVNIHEPEGFARCGECSTEYHLEKIFDVCPNCKSPFKEILKGKELKIIKLIID